MRLISIAVMMFLSACQAYAPTQSPFFDGDCAEYESLGAKKIVLSDNVDLFAYQTSSQVWLCYTLPGESFGMAEIEIDAPALDGPYILHISAQLGDWPKGDDTRRPENAESDLWWNQEGWFANTAYFSGYETEGGETFAKFKSAKGREIVLSPSRFGRGTWRMRFDIRGIESSAGEMGSLLFPENEADIFEIQVP